MKHKPDAEANATRLIDLHRSQGLSFPLAARAALITIEESTSRNDSLRQRTLNKIREIVYGPETATLIHDKESELQKAYGHRGFEYSMPEDDDLTDDDVEEEYNLQKEAYDNRIATLKAEIAELKKKYLL
jgi:hypothetical protein